MLGRSILEQRAEKKQIPDISKATANIQAVLYCETLVQMNIFLDTAILRRLPRDSMDVLLKDVIKILSGMLVLQSTSSRPKEISTIDGALEGLRLIRDHFQVAYGMYKGDLIIESKSTKFLTELRLARRSIDDVLSNFEENLTKELKSKISNELLLKGKQ